MAGFAPEPGLPRLDLSGPVLREALEDLDNSAAPFGGVEVFLELLRLKAAGFQAVLTDGNAASLGEADFVDLCGFVAPARRRAGKWMADHEFALMRGRIGTLLEGRPDAREADARIEAFVGAFASEGSPRWARDLAAELLHFCFPGQIPLMTRWMWDAATQTGVLRQIWHEADALPDGLAVTDHTATFVALREELFEFLRGNGVFRDLAFVMDLLCSHIYGAYIDRCGNVLFKTQFNTARDGMVHTRRLLGLDAAALRQLRQCAA